MELAKKFNVCDGSPWCFFQDGHKPFLQEHHSNGNDIFWLDSASCHFSCPTTTLFDKLEIPFFAKAENPSSVAKLRLVEDFGSLLKGKVSQDGWEADSEQQLKNRIKKRLWELNWEAVRGSMAMVKTNLREAAGQSPQSFWVLDRNLPVYSG